MSGIWLETVYCDQNDDENETSSNSLYFHQKLHHLLEIDVKKPVSCCSVLSELDNHLESILMERLFEVCDKQGKGRVRVSDIMDYLETILNVPLSEDGDVGNLIKILDPENLNTEVDLEIFKKGLLKWIAGLKQDNEFHNRNSSLNVLADESFFTKNETVKSSIFLENSLDEPKADDRTSLTDLSGKLADSHFQCQRISDENRELKILLESKEEELVKLCKELLEAKLTIKRLQELTDILHATQAENLEFRHQISTLDGELLFEKQSAHLVNLEGTELKEQIGNYEEQLTRLNSEMNDSLKHVEALKASLAENKEKLLQFEDIYSILETQVIEKNERIQELVDSLQKACKYCEDLKYEKQDLLIKLTETELELSSLKSVHVPNTCSSLPGFVASDVELTKEIEEDTELKEVDRSDDWTSSICQELKQLFSYTPSLSWPLSKKELNESVVTTSELVCHIRDYDHSIDERETTSIDDFHDGKRFHFDSTDGKNPNYDISNEKLRFLYTFLKKLKEENKRLQYLSKHLINTSFKKYNISQPQNQPDPNLTVYVKVINPEISFQYLIEYNTMLISQVEKLKRSNFELSEKLHKTELKLTELDEEAQNTYSYLERERQKCADLEENVCSSTLARQLDLRDIWRLVQKDVESECQDQQEDFFNSVDSEQIKEKIKRDIEALRSKLHNSEAALGVLKDTYLSPGLLCNCKDVQNSVDWYTGSSLVDALTIDVLNGNLPMYPIKYTYSSSLVSCEDVDCYECSAARLRNQTRYTSSCPSISPVHNFSFSNNNFTYGDTFVGNNGASSDNTHSTSQNTTSQTSGSPKRQRSLYGNNRRQDFIKRSGKCAVINKTQSVNSDQQIDMAGKNKKINSSDDFLSSGNHIIKSSLSAKYNNEVPSLVRRSSFKRAMEGEDQPECCVPSGSHLIESDCDELRRPSFCAAIEKGKEKCHASSTKRKIVQVNSPDSLKVRTKNMKEYGVHCEPSKTVTFQLNEEEVDDQEHSHFPVIDGISSYCCRLPSTFQTLPSSLMAASYTCISSEPENDVVRSDSTQSYKLQMFLEDVQAYTVPKSMEDWDMAPQNVGYDQDPEHIENLSDPEQEAKKYIHPLVRKHNSWYIISSNQELPDVSEYIHDVGDMQGSVSSTVPEKETVPVQSSKDDTSLFDQSVKPRQIKSADTTRINERPVSSSKQHPVAAVHSSPSIPAPSTSSSIHGSIPEAALSLPAAHNRGGESGYENRKTHLHDDTSTIKGNNKSVPVSDSTSSTSEVETECPKIVVPPSPPSPRNNISFIHEPQPLGPTRLSKLRQSHLSIKRKDQVKGRSMKLPELSENSELDITETPTALIQTKDPHTSSTAISITSGSREQDMPHISVTSVDYLEPPAPANDPVTPSLPSSFLKRLGLSDKVKSSEQEENKDNGVSVDQLPQKEIESKFISLSLAFKTDKFTLEQRVSVQERARDLAEQNVDAEIKGLRELLESLNELVSDPQARAMVQKLRQHIEVLEQAAARVSSRAEVYGAVQQEKRMCKAMEVMVLYTENIRRLREREESELLEARKLLSERSVNGFSMDTDPSPSRRSMSVSGVSPGGRPMRRRSEIALPRVLGGSGSPSMIQTNNMETVSPFMERSYPNYNFLSVSTDMAVGEDAKSRFQSAVASTSMQHAVTNTMRKVSLEKQRSMSFSPSTSPSSFNSASWTPPSSFIRDDHQSVSGLADSGRKISQEEDAFRKGYEEGLKAKLSKELNELKEQQNCINQNLEQMMDKVDQSEQEDEEFLSRPTRLDTLLNYSSRFTQQIIHHDWSSNKKVIRNMAGLLLVFLAIFVVFLSPPVSTVDVKQMTQPPT